MTKAIVLAVGSFLVATLLMLGGPSKSAQAQTPPEPTPAAITFFKECDGLDGTFDFLLDLEFEEGNVTEAGTQVDEDTTFDLPVSLSCGVALVLEAGDELAAVLAWGQDANVQEEVDDGTMFVQELNLPDGTVIAFSGDCVDTNADSIGEIDVVDPTGQLEQQFVNVGFLCVITNTLAAAPEVELADLIITKVCLTGDGDGDADFNVVVMQLETAVAADALDCGEVMVVPGLAPGLYTITELITGPDGGNFVTAIICHTTAGDIVTPGSQAQVSVSGTDVSCSVVNAFQEPDNVVGGEDPGAPAAPTIIVPVTITNTNNNDGTVITTNSNGGVVVNTNTNSGGQVLDNQNEEHNDNINDNTQRQTAERSQTNDSSQ